MSAVLYASEDFWKDVKELKKYLSSKLTDCPFSDEDFKQLPCLEKMGCIPLLNSISRAIINTLGNLNSLPNNVRNGRQPFLAAGFVLWKMRWAVDKNGARYGLRAMYAINEENIVFLAVKRKKDIATSEAAFQILVKERLEYFLACGEIK